MRRLWAVFAGLVAGERERRRVRAAVRSQRDLDVYFAGLEGLPKGPVRPRRPERDRRLCSHANSNECVDDGCWGWEPDSPGSDHPALVPVLSDLDAAVARGRSLHASPHRVRVTSAFLERLTGSVVLVDGDSAIVGQSSAALLGVPLVVDDMLPAFPGWVLEW